MNVKRKKIFLIISEINLALIRKAALQNSVNFVEIIYRTIICRNLKVFIANLQNCFCCPDKIFSQEMFS